eukprot:m.137183 g.137183  ORF g.137183 m.137183 type:complete len:79 (-) comp11383_c0_seq1:736-972(-)
MAPLSVYTTLLTRRPTATPMMNAIKTRRTEPCPVAVTGAATVDVFDVEELSADTVFEEEDDGGIDLVDFVVAVVDEEG